MSNEKPGYVMSVLTNKCPRCREGHIYKSSNPYNLRTVTDMHERCPVCGQPTDLEVGFYYGTSYVSYMLAVILCGVSFVAWWLIIGFSFKDNRFFWWIGVNALLLIVVQPLLMRLSRTLWLSWFVKYDPNWKEHPLKPGHLERIVPEQMGNW